MGTKGTRETKGKWGTNTHKIKINIKTIERGEITRGIIITRRETTEIQKNKRV